MSPATTPRVSVGLPVYNGERYLAQAIDGILGQSFEDLELVISDNASTDGTEDIAREAVARDARVRYLRNARNIGASANYNQAVALARGPYFKWQAHDDVCAPGYVARCVEVLDADPDVVLAFPRVADIDEDGEVVHVWPSLSYATEATPGARALSMLRFPSPCFESFGLTRREVLLDTGMIGLYTSSDRTLFLDLCLRGRFHEVDELLFLHRQHATRSVHKFKNDRERNAWFDPARANVRTSPRWRLLQEYARSIASAPVGPRDRALALTGLPPWMVQHRRKLAGEAGARVLGVAAHRRPGPAPTRPVAS